MVRQHHQPNAYESEQTLGCSEGQGSLECCSSWNHKESDRTEQLNNNKVNAKGLNVIRPFFPVLSTYITFICMPMSFLHLCVWNSLHTAQPNTSYPSSKLVIANPPFQQHKRRLLRVPWTARGSNQSILQEINSESSLEALMLKLKLQYFGHLT